MLRPAGKRASAPKVRSGCLTCKARRVKCDETKPRCKQCTKSMRECQWKRTTTQTTTRPLVPIITSKIRTAAALVKAPSQALPFADNREPLYFRTYQEEVALELAVALRESPWFASVLQACHTEPSILRAVVAIGALNKSWKLAHFANHGPVSMKSITLRAASSHREFALSSYSQALFGLKKISLLAPTNPKALRHILIGCLLVHCMEVYLQSTAAAFEHSTVGYNLLLDWIAANPSATQSYKWTSSPNTAIIEDAVFHEYTRLQNDRSRSPYSPPLSYHQKSRQIGAETITNMPILFKTLEEAQSFQELLEQRTTHLIAEIRATVKQTHVLLAHPLASSLPGHILDPCTVPHLSHLVPIRDEYLSSLRAWRDAFAPLLARLSLSPDTYLSVGAAINQTRSLNSIAELTTILSPYETSYDEFYSSYAEIISLILRSIKLTPHICNDLRPIFQCASSFHHPINSAAASCRDKAVREQAIATMIRMSPRDADRERVRSVFSHKYLIALEEANRSPDGTLPLHLRYRLVSWHIYDPDETLTVIATRRISNGPQTDLYPSLRGYRWKIFTREQCDEFDVGEIVSDLDGEEAVDAEREEEMKKWPKSVQKLPWIQWWQIFKELKVKARRRAQLLELELGLEDLEEIPVQGNVGLDLENDEDGDQGIWEDMLDDPVLPLNPTGYHRRQQEVIIEQIGGFGGFGAWVPQLDIHPGYEQDLAAIARASYLAG